MKLSEYRMLSIRQPELDRIVLSDRERKTLAAAAVILERLRSVRNARVPIDWYAGDEDDCDLLFGWRICDELARDGDLDAELVS